MVVLGRFFFIWGTKKVAAGHNRQGVILKSNNCMGIDLGGLNMGCLIDKWLSYGGGCISRFDCTTWLILSCYGWTCSKKKMHFSQKSDICIIFYALCLPKVNLQKFGSNLNADGEVKRSQILIFKVHLNYTKHSRAIASYFREVFDTSRTSCIHCKWLLFSISLRLIVPWNWCLGI